MSLLIARAGNIGGGAGAPADAAYITQTPNAALANEQALSALATGLLKNTTVTGVLSIAAEGADYFNPPFTDTNALVKGSADPTKLLRWEIDGFTAGATRVMTPPNQNTTLAGQNFANAFSQPQAIDISLTTASTTNALAGEIANSSTGSLRGLSYAARSTLVAGTMPFLIGIKGQARNTAAGTVTNGYALYADLGQNSGGGVIGTNYGLFVADQNVGALNFAILTNAGNVVFNEGGDALTDFRVEGDTDANLLFTDASADFVGIGTSAPGNKFHTLLSNAATAAIVNVGRITLNSTGTPAAGFGPGFIFGGESSTTNDQDMGRLTWEWGVATHASRASKGKLTAFAVASEIECILWDSTGLVTMPMLRLTSVTALSLSSTLHALQTGLTASTNIIMDTTGIQARSNGALANLNLNPSGGNTVTPLLRATSTAANALATASNAFMVGGSASLANLVFDPSSIQARNNGVAATLNLNQLGGNILIGIVTASLGFYGSAAVAKQTVTGSRGGNAALADLLTKLATLGLIVDGSSA